MQRKISTQINVLACLTGSTWGLPLHEDRQVYQMVVLLSIVYACNAWHNPTISEKPRGLATKMETIQYCCLCLILGGFRATPVHALETLSNVASLDLILTAQVARYRQSLENSNVKSLIEQQSTQIHHDLINMRDWQP